MKFQNLLSFQSNRILLIFLFIITLNAPVLLAQQKLKNTELSADIKKLDQLHNAYQFDSMKVFLDRIESKIKEDSTTLSLFEFGYTMGQYHLFLGHFFRQQFSVDSATYHYQKAMDYHSKYTDYLGWFEAMTLSIEYLFAKSNHEAYLKELESGHLFLKNLKPELAAKEYALYLKKKFYPTQDQELKLEILHKVDSIFSAEPSTLNDRNNFIYFLDVLEWAYQTNQAEIIDKYLPLYNREIEKNAITAEYDNYFKALFAQAANQIEDAIAYNKKVADSALAPLNIKGSSIKNLYSLYLSRLDSANAFVYFRKLIQLRDSTEALARYDEAENLRKEYEKESLKFKLGLAELENLRQVRIILILGSGFLLITTVALYLLKRNQFIKHKRLLTQTALEQMQELSRNKELVWLSKLALLEHMKNNGNAKNQDSIQFSNNFENEDYSENDFENIPSFIRDQLLEINNKISNRELKFASFIYAGYDNIELERIFAVSPDAIRKAKYRLKLKLGLDKKHDLRAFIQNLNIKNPV